MSQALYRKYRAKNLREIIGQEHVTDVLESALQKGRLSHAYLLTGPRGIGKTSIARVLAHEITQLPYDGTEHLDIIEIDAASNNGVEDIRNLRDKVQIAPLVAKHKVYIVDEVHMLSRPAFNALLKTLEEPPEHIVFILATTDPEKMPETVISRTQRFNLRRISQKAAVGHLKKIAKKEAIDIEPAALSLLADYGDGSFRDSINLLDQLSGLGGDNSITVSNIRSHLGVASEQLVETSLEAYRNADLGHLVSLVEEIENQGLSATVFSRQLIKTCTKQLPAQPNLLPLIDSLIEVEASRRPEIALLIALSGNVEVDPTPKASAKPKTKTEESAPVKPSSPNVTESKKVNSSSGASKKTAATTHSSKKKIPNLPRSAASKPSVDALPKPADSLNAQRSAKDSSKQESVDFPWKEVTATIKSESIGMFNLLTKSQPHFDGQTLTIYAGNRLYKNKLDTTKCRSLLVAASTDLGVNLAEIQITAEKPPIADPELASVATLMGGGEVVSI